MIVIHIFFGDKQILFSPPGYAGYECVPEHLPPWLVKQSCLCSWKMLGHNLYYGYLVKRECCHIGSAFGKMFSPKAPWVLWTLSEGGRLLEQTLSWDLVRKLDLWFSYPCLLFLSHPYLHSAIKKKLKF